MKVFNLLLILVIFGCHSMRPNENIRLNIPFKILLEFKNEKYDQFGIPVKKLNLKDQIIIYKNDTTIVQNDTTKLILNLSMNGEMELLFQEGDYSVEGQFIIPDYNQTGYISIFDPITFNTDTLKPYYYKQPIRTGKWIFMDNGETFEINYNTIIDRKFIKEHH